MATRRSLPLVASSLGFALAAALLALLASPPAAGARAATVTREPGPAFVAPGGTGPLCQQDSPCGSVQYAVDQAVPGNGDTIYVAGGVYTGTGAAVISVTKSVTLYGGWDGTPSGPPARDPAAHPTTLDGEGRRRVVYFGGNVAPKLDSFTITHGNGTGLTAGWPMANKPDGIGGGILVVGAHPTIAGNVITHNVAAVTTAGFPTSTTGYGGGICLINAGNTAITGNRIISNAASLAFSGTGGGLYIYGNASGTRVQANRIAGNWATTTDDNAGGGGIAIWANGTLVTGNLVENNRANATGSAEGAGLWEWFGTTHYEDNVVRGNTGVHAVYLGHSRSLFERNQVVGNATAEGIRLFCSMGSGSVLANNVVARSGDKSFAATAAPAYPLTASLLHNTLAGAGPGSGLYVEPNVTLYMTNTIVVDHKWGVSVTIPASPTVHADHTLYFGCTYGRAGTNVVIGDPAFVDPDAGDYHLGLGSAALEAGVDAGIHTDMDGDPRPLGPGYEIGADERLVYYRSLPLVLRN